MKSIYSEIYFSNDCILTLSDLRERFEIAKTENDDFPFSCFESWLSNCLNSWLSDSPADIDSVLMILADEIADFSDSYAHDYDIETNVYSETLQSLYNNPESLADWLTDFTFYDDFTISDTAGNLITKIYGIIDWL